jgi:uncharacterized damage-inducible protein DinB
MDHMENALTHAFLDASVRRLRQYRDRIRTCIAQLTPEQVWSRGSSHLNAAGNLLLHLNGNVRQWIVSGVGGAPDHRDRDSEFAALDGAAGPALVDSLSATVEEACRVIELLTPRQLLEHRRIQAYEVTVLEAVYHVVEHFALHTGQIILLTKWHAGEDLGFYRHLAPGAPDQHSEPTP